MWRTFFLMLQIVPKQAIDAWYVKLLCKERNSLIFFPSFHHYVIHSISVLHKTTFVSELCTFANFVTYCVRYSSIANLAFLLYWVWESQKLSALTTWKALEGTLKLQQDRGTPLVQAIPGQLVSP